MGMYRSMPRTTVPVSTDVVVGVGRLRLQFMTCNIKATAAVISWHAGHRQQHNCACSHDLSHCSAADALPIPILSAT
jgi:hypothetical protein